MSNTGIVALTRQTGLVREMQTIANNVANMSTTGYRREGLIFSEYVHQAADAGTVAMAAARVRNTDLAQGTLSQTGGAFDFAIEGEGFFMIQTPQGDQLTRAGNFSPNAFGDLVTADGYPLLDAGGAPVFVPPDAQNITLASDGTLSADGAPLTQIGLYSPADPSALSHVAGVRFSAEEVIPVESATLLQGFVEDSNVNPVNEITRMIEVQRAYEMGQKFLDQENDRIRNVLKTLT